MNKTSIEWTHRPETGDASGGFTWNPIRAKRIHAEADRDLKPGTFCTRISPGCKNCYASVINKRFGTGAEYTVPNLADHEFYIDEKILAQPLKRKRPATIFVGDMFDLFHEAIPDEMITRVFRMMCETSHRHTFQVLTKRAERMHHFFGGWDSRTRDFGPLYPYMWPRGSIWLGVSVEDQQRADERVPLLLQTPATVRFLSVEPQLEAVNLECFVGDLPEDEDGAPYPGTISWVICGGESGPGARPFNLAWAESLLTQCRAAGIPFFMKQVGSNFCLSDTKRQLTKSRKGGDPAEWPEQFRVREFPASEGEARGVS
jgi:protein gp37